MKKQVIILELKNRITEMKNSMDRLNNGMKKQRKESMKGR